MNCSTLLQLVSDKRCHNSFHSPDATFPRMRPAMTHGFQLIAPPPELCSDNAVMIAWAGAERLALGLADNFDAPARPRWPLDESAPALLGGGAKGVKA